MYKVSIYLFFFLTETTCVLVWQSVSSYTTQQSEWTTDLPSIQTTNPYRPTSNHRP